MKGYVLPFGYMGWVEKYGRYMMFATEDEYKEWMEGRNVNHDNNNVNI